MLNAIFKILEKCDIESNTYFAESFVTKNVLQKEWQLIGIILCIHFEHYLCSKRCQRDSEIIYLRTASSLKCSHPGVNISPACATTLANEVFRSRNYVYLRQIKPYDVSYLGWNFS